MLFDCVMVAIVLWMKWRLDGLLIRIRSLERLNH